MRASHGAGMARHARVILRGGLQLAVMATVLGSNPVRDISPIMSKGKPKGARALTGDELRELLAKLRTSEFCQKYDLVDPITMLIATGLRRSELLGLRWADYDRAAATISVTGKVSRVTPRGWSGSVRPRPRPGRERCRCRGSLSTCSRRGARCPT